MEKFYLEIPSLSRKEDAINYLKEFEDFNLPLDGVGNLRKCLKGKLYEEWLKENELMENKEYTESKNFVPSTTYFMIRLSDNKIIGLVNFRHYLNERLSKFGGHIGYGIRPSERKKGYSKIILYLVLLEISKFGLDKVMIDCIDTNIASERTIISLGGKFYEAVHEENKDVILHNYWINVNESIKKYKYEYEKYIRKENRK